MKFEPITRETLGAQKAGYRIGSTDTFGYDPEIRRAVEAHRDEAYINDLFDALYDNDGDAYRGDDGKTYAVQYAYWYEGGKDRCEPLCWVELIHD